MAARASTRGRISFSISCGILVGAFTAGTHWLLLPHDRALMTHLFMGDFISVLAAVIVCLAIGLRYEDGHFLDAMSCVTIVSELNHQIRSTLFPLCLAAQKIGDKETSHLADEAVERINVALREANADAISGRGSRM